MTTEAANVPETMKRLKAELAVLEDLSQAQSLLSWDQNTYMPDGAATARAQQMATLSKLSHERLTNPSVREMLSTLESAAPSKDSTESGAEDDAESASDKEDDAALLEVTRRNVARAVKLPSDFVEDFTKARSAGQQAWIRARANADFALFAPHLDKILDFARRQADYLGYDDHPYDALHDLYERGSSTAKVRTVFAELRDATVPLVKDVVEKGRDIDDSSVHQPFGEALQEQFGTEVVKSFGYDFEHGRLDRTVHPFATGISKYDVRITTRYQPDFLNPALFGTMHEAGHAMYEQGIASRYDRSPLGNAVSLGIHESQSRLWENLVGRSYGFWEFYYPRLQEVFPAQLGEVSLDDFYAAINKLEPSLIRVEADEVTYNLHVMVRFELELALLEGSLSVQDLPDAWNAKYEDYLGLTPPDNAQGCLQDIHWSFGAIGYFPTYTLGNIMSVQLFEAAKRAHPELEKEIRQGTFTTLLGWLRGTIHQHGSKYEPSDLLQRAVGGELDAKPYINYLNTKFRSLYGVEEGDS